MAELPTPGRKPEGDVYWDEVKKMWRPRKGRRVRRHGPMSQQEEDAEKMYYRVIGASRRMPHTYATIGLPEVTDYLRGVALYFEQNSFEKTRDLADLDEEGFREGLENTMYDAPKPVVPDEDVYGSIRDELQ